MKKQLFMVAGFLSLALGVIGIILPIMPTAPFVILAAYCFSKGSERWHKWLIHHPKMGPPIRDWEDHGVIRKKAKIMATVFVTIGWSISGTFSPIPVWAKLTITSIIVCVMIFIWSRPSEPRNKGAVNG